MICLSIKTIWQIARSVIAFGADYCMIAINGAAIAGFEEAFNRYAPALGASDVGHVIIQLVTTGFDAYSENSGHDCVLSFQ